MAPASQPARAALILARDGGEPERPVFPDNAGGRPWTLPAPT